MRSSRQREMNYHNLNADEYSDPLLQPFHQEWASQLSREDDSPQYRDSNYQQSDDRDDRESNRYQEDRRHKESRSHNVDRSYKSHSNERRSENYSQKNHDRSPRKSNRSYSPDERDKRNRRHSRDRSRRYSRSHSRERSRRYTRSRSRSRSLSRSRSRSRSRRSYNRDRYDDDKSRYGRKDSQTSREPPSNTIMLRGLAQHITQEDIIAEVEQCKIETKQIRLIRKKFTGASRGFAFVEFNTIEDAQRWMEMKQGSIMFHGQYRALMQYAVPRESSETHGDMNDDNPENNFYPPRFLADWTCTKCGGINFKRRENCFKCSTSRQESSLGIEGTDEISDTVTTRIIIQNLDVLTKEEGLRAELESRTPGLISLIVSLKIPRDSTTSLSRGLAYLTFNCEDDCKIAYDTLNNCDPPFVVDNKSVIISYCLEEGIKKSNSNKAIPKPSRGTSFTIADVPKLAAYSAELYAKSPEQKQQYLMYYTNYYMQQIAQGITISMPQTQSDETNSAAAVAHQAIMKMQNKNRINNAIDQAHAMGMSQIQVPTGTDDKVYAVPDISSYYYDQSSGYYYDVLTGLYYDPNTQYYYNSQINKFLYWDNTKRTYLLAPEGTESTVAAASSQQSAGDQNKSKGNDDSSSEPKSKSDKVKVAKRIAKDMERWAKTLNQKKEISKRNIEPTQPTPQPIVQPKSAVADICFSMVEKSERSLGKFENPLAKYSSTIVSDTTDSPLEAQKPLVPSKFTKDPPMDVRPNSVTKEQVYIDFEKLACLICKRQFASREILIKHTKMSTLHKQNLQLLGINT